MKSSIDKFGRILIPKSIRDHLGISTGTDIRIKESDNKIILVVMDTKSHLQRKQGVLVFTGEAQADLESALQKSRDERIENLW